MSQLEPRAMAAPLWDGLELRRTPSTGLGLFATRRFAKGEVITTVEGEEETWEYDDEPEYGATYYGVGHNRWVAVPDDSAAKFVNHSCEPSARMKDVRTVVAARDIDAGEQVTIDYATTEEDPGWTLTCRCGSPSCRGMVRGEAKFDG